MIKLNTEQTRGQKRIFQNRSLFNLLTVNRQNIDVVLPVAQILNAMSIERLIMKILGQQAVMLRGCFRQDDYSSHIFRAGCLLTIITEMCF